MSVLLLPTFTGMLILWFISAIHLYWAAGGSWGARSALPQLPASGQPVFLPGRFATAAVALLTAAAGVLLLLRAVPYLIPGSGMPAFWSTAGCWVCAAVFGLRTIGDFQYFGWFKRVRGTSFAQMDSRLFTPLCLLLCLLFLWSLLVL